jgi:predicted MPP superfamily phosphohydrolase
MVLSALFLLSAMLHGLVAWRVAPDIAIVSSDLSMGFLCILAFSAILLPMSIFAKRLAKPPLSDVLTWLGLLCMGLFSTLFVLMLLREVLLLIALGVDWVFPIAALLQRGFRQYSALGVPVLGLILTVLGFWNARRTATVVRVDVPITNLPDALVGFTVAQISDIHVGPTIKTQFLQRIVQRVNGLNADLVAITGNLVDGSVRELEQHVQPLSGLRSTHGTYFVTGNHEYYSGAHAWIDTLRKLEITVLMNEHVVINHSTSSEQHQTVAMVVAGVADFSAHHFDETHRSDPAAALANAPAHSVFKLLLAHQPRSAAAASVAGFDLQLSGHTHGGQFWPWMYFVKLQQPFTAGLHRLEKLWVYTSRGTGYWGPPKRFGAPSEITYLRLVRA